MLRIKDLPDSERPREKMLSRGASTLSNNELLALIINSGNKQDSALGLASKVLALDKGGLRGLLNCQPEEYKSVEGIGTALACRICASVEFGRRIAAAPQTTRIRLDQPQKAVDLFMENMRHLQAEKLMVAMINSKGDLIAVEDVAMGGLYYANTAPREIFMKAVRKGAYGILLAHNHPSGDPTPSKEDIDLTKQVALSGELIGIKLIDHLIIGDGVYVSLKNIKRLVNPRVCKVSLDFFGLSDL